MTTYIVAAALTAFLFVTFMAMAKRGCGDPGCGTHPGCGACPNAKQAPHRLSPEHSDD